MILLRFRHGIGLDIEYNEDICHILTDGKTEDVVAFVGVIIKIPFITIYLGEFYDLEDEPVKA